MKVRLPIPHTVLEVSRRIEEQGFSCVLVGGCVRDALLGRAPTDWDLATSARPEEVMALFRRTVPTGIQHGTVSVLVDGPPGRVEVTTFRQEGPYSDGRRPDAVTFVGTLEADLERRDFTINAMALHPTKGELIDPLGGLRDLEMRRIRAVRDPGERFREDALRILRAVRFAVQLDFAIEETTWRAMQAYANRLGESTGRRRVISWERIRDELLKMLASPQPVRALDLLRDAGILPHVLPELVPEERYKHSRLTLVGLAGEAPTSGESAGIGEAAGERRRRRERGGWGDRTTLRLAALWHHAGTPDDIARWCRRLRLSRVCMTAVVGWAQALPLAPFATPAQIREWIGTRGLPWVWGLGFLAGACAQAAGKPFEGARFEFAVQKALEPPTLFHLKQLAVTGRDLVDVLGIEPGPQVGRLLHQLFTWALEDPTRNEREQLLARACELLPAPGGDRKGR